MDAGRIDMQVLSLWSPGVQIFGSQQGTELARHTNDVLAAAIGRNPTRFAGLTTIAPQDPDAAAISHADRQMIYSGNARRVFHIS